MMHRASTRAFVLGAAVGLVLGLLLAGSTVFAQFGTPRPREVEMPWAHCYVLGDSLSCIPSS
jgi:hypothetical protein